MLAKPSSGTDCRELHKYVTALVNEVNALMNMLVVWEGRSKGAGYLQMQGNTALVRIVTRSSDSITYG